LLAIEKLKLPTISALPDAFVACTEGPDGSTLVQDPVIVFEILSEGTSRIDRIVKNEECRATPSIRRYVMLEQDAVAATVFCREGGDWIGHVLSGDVPLALPEISAELRLAELYADLGFGAEAAQPL
jgi:Uma2 family endonuclease